MQVPLATRPEGVGQTEWTAVCRINDAILKRVRYDHDRARSVSPLVLQSPQETLRRGLGVCMDYAALFEASARRVGIRTKSVMSQSLNHAWNAVHLDGVWWNVDVTWNAGGTVTSAGALPDQLRNDVDFRRRYLLTTAASEASMLSFGLTQQTHLTDDVREVDFTKTLQAMALIARIEGLISGGDVMTCAQQVASADVDKSIEISGLYQEYRRLEEGYSLAVKFRLRKQPRKGGS
ncbi:transglutaminase domain-containing protein [Arthrobacter sp. cf158]|uniref:transglutaminase domain-containing protein n=1 Tax=Arthrobacter sp. cf158 TaxID=1761744 RepID=UPI0034A3411D